MCPTPLGRIQTRVAILTLPALLGALLSLITGNEGWIVLIGVYLLMGVALDAGVYSWLIRYQPPWMTGVLGLVEFGLLLVLASVLDVGLSLPEAIVFYWVSWLLAAGTRIVMLPILSLTYLESATEFRRAEWSIPASQVTLPALPASAEAGPLVRSASGVHPVPLERRPSPSGVHAALPDDSAPAGQGAER
jgi:hypothetical protein